MLKADGKDEDLERVFRSKQSSAELELIFARTDCCSNEKCIRKIIASCGSNDARSKSNESSSSRSLHGTASYYCRQIGIPTKTQTSLFDQYVNEIRKPFQEYVFGTDSKLEANRQLRTYLVQKFQESRTLSDTNKTGNKWSYQLYSMSRPAITVCKTAFIAMTGISKNIIDYSQSLVRSDHVGDVSVIESSSKVKSLKDAFEYFCLDYDKYECNINRFVCIDNVVDSTKSFIATTFLAEWFGLAGELEVFSRKSELSFVSE